MRLLINGINGIYGALVDGIQFLERAVGMVAGTLDGLCNGAQGRNLRGGILHHIPYQEDIVCCLLGFFCLAGGIRSDIADCPFHVLHSAGGCGGIAA